MIPLPMDVPGESMDVSQFDTTWGADHSRRMHALSSVSSTAAYEQHLGGQSFEGTPFWHDGHEYPSFQL
jgi:hypothetical protein